MEEILKEYIPLQHAHVTQSKSRGVKSDWKVRKNVTHDEIATLSVDFSDKDIFRILAFSRKFELEAFNIGIDFGKEKQNNTNRQVVSEYKARVQALTNENSRLAEVLDRVTRQNN